jgi:hypothetical protein
MVVFDNEPAVSMLCCHASIFARLFVSAGLCHTFYQPTYGGGTYAYTDPEKSA